MDTEIDGVIARYFSGEATAGDRAALDGWLAASPANEEEFAQLTQLFETAAAVPAARQPDGERALALFRAHIRAPRQRAVRRWLYWPAAAVLVLGVVLTVFPVHRHGGGALDLVAVPSGEMLVLPDNTVVTLSGGSRIVCDRHFGEQHRRVRLFGRATFDVGTHSAGQFTVLAGDLVIRDIGTVFTVDTAAGGDTVRVAVATGAVLFTSIENARETRIDAGETGVYDRVSGTVETLRPPAAAPLVFDAATLEEVVAVLRQRYGVAVHLADASLAQRRISVRFREGEEVHTVLTVVAETLLLALSVDEGKYILSAR